LILDGIGPEIDLRKIWERKRGLDGIQVLVVLMQFVIGAQNMKVRIS
jgi:hypothetical protein